LFEGGKIMELWYTEEHTDNVRFSIKVKEHLYHGESEFQKIDFFDSQEFGKFFTLDGLMMVNEKDEFVYHDMIVHVPMATNPDIKNVLVIGGGDGGTVRELTRYPHIEKIDMVEIDEKVVRLSEEYLPITASNLNDPRVSLYFEDGVAFVDGLESAYDLIIVDSTDPIGPGEGLFSKAFYDNCYRALTEDGILVNQHESPYYERDAREMKRAHSKIKKLFNVSKVYQFHMPTYPSGHWLFGFASKKYDPLKDAKLDEWNKLELKTKYYNTEIHKGSFALPSFVRDMLEEV
jgi:spermidine synthase